jgi:hypothetical protein
MCEKNLSYERNIRGLHGMKILIHKGNPEVKDPMIEKELGYWIQTLTTIIS